MTTWLFAGSPGAWAVRTAAAALVSVAAVGATVWVVGDRLLAHALTGFASSVGDLRADLGSLRGEVREASRTAGQSLVQALARSDVIEVRVTGDVARLATEVAGAQRRLDDSLGGLRADVGLLRAELRDASRMAGQQFVEALAKSQVLEVKVTGDFAKLATELVGTQRRLEELIVRVDATNERLDRQAGQLAQVIERLPRREN